MLRKRTFIQLTVVLCLIWLVIPSSMVTRSKSGSNVSVATRVPAISAPAAESERYAPDPQPVYFSIFRFITNFIPGRH